MVISVDSNRVGRHNRRGVDWEDRWENACVATERARLNKLKSA